MKHSKKPTMQSGNFPRVSGVLMWALPLLLIVPNLALDYTEMSYSLFSRLTNLLLPFGVYLLSAAWGGRIGRKILLFIPVMVLCAFQIVLLFLYGESIIAIDMFLNVVTTNPHEAGELLLNLGPAIMTVLALYLPLIAGGIWAEVRGARISRKMLGIGRRTGLCVMLAGAISVVVAYTATDGYRITRQLFPVNVVSNMIEAGHRSTITSAYPEVSKGYEYHCIDPDPDGERAGQVIVMVVGETSRANHWSLGGYERETTPRLAQRRGLVYFPKVLTESNTTHKSVPLMLSHLTASEFGDSIYAAGSVVDAFNEAGYKTAWLSNQAHNHSLIDFYSDRAGMTEYLCDECEDDEALIQDTELAPKLDKFIAAQEPGAKIFVVVHTYGSHFNYKERYTDDDRIFTPDDASSATKENRPDLVNAYDNSICATDRALDSLITVLERTGRPAVMVYAADHGEDIFDDDRERFLHASPSPTYYQIHVPMFVWMSSEYESAHPEAEGALIANKNKNVSSSESVFHTLVSMAGLRLPVLEDDLSLISPGYREPQRRYLNDYDESVDLVKSGLHPEDIAELHKKDISIR